MSELMHAREAPPARGEEVDKVELWLSRFASSTQVNYEYHFGRWMEWMAVNGGPLAGLSPAELLAFQDGATNSDRYIILDLLQRHSREILGRYNYKLRPYTAVRSFFRHSRAPLPQEEFRPRAEVPPVMGDLPLDEAKQVILSSNPCYRAIFLCILQGGMDEAGVCDWSNGGVGDLRREISEIAHMRRDKRILRIDLPGRKKYRNIRPFYTYIGSDAVDALEDWLRKRPLDARTVFVNQYGEPITEESMRRYWNRKLKTLGFIVPGEPGNKSNRYGKNLHELRDVFRSQWEKSPAKGSVAEFMMGHQIDPLEYNKACRDRPWTLGEYRKALPMVEIMSSGRPFGQVEEDEVRDLKDEIDQLKAQILSDSQQYEKGTYGLVEVIKGLTARVAAIEKNV